MKYLPTIIVSLILLIISTAQAGPPVTHKSTHGATATPDVTGRAQQERYEKQQVKERTRQQQILRYRQQQQQLRQLRSPQKIKPNSPKKP